MLLASAAGVGILFPAVTRVTWWVVSGERLLPPEELVDLKLLGSNSLFPWQLEEQGTLEVLAKKADPLFLRRLGT